MAHGLKFIVYYFKYIINYLPHIPDDPRVAINCMLCVQPYN